MNLRRKWRWRRGGGRKAENRKPKSKWRKLSLRTRLRRKAYDHQDLGRNNFEGIIYVLRTGCQWSALPREEFAPNSTVWPIQPMGEAGLFQPAWALVLNYYDLEIGIGWKWEPMVGAIHSLPSLTPDHFPVAADLASVFRNQGLPKFV